MQENDISFVPLVGLHILKHSVCPSFEALLYLSCVTLSGETDVNVNLNGCKLLLASIMCVTSSFSVIWLFSHLSAIIYFFQLEKSY